MEIQVPDINTYDYALPDEKIAKHPLPVRDQSKLLYRNNKGHITGELFTNLPQLLCESDFLVFNNTRVIKARIPFRKTTGARIEIFCLEPLEPSDYYQNFQSPKRVVWKCLIGNKKKWKDGKLVLSFPVNKQKIELSARILNSLKDSYAVEFSWNSPSATFGDIIEKAGNLPIPPYLNRDTELSDLKRYQTVYSKIKGSVAAPTAGLHFTDDVFNSLQKKGINWHEITLHVGAGTFKPVKEKNLLTHTMHTEHFSVDRTFIEWLITHKPAITAVGTTSVRTLESLYHLGIKIMKNPDTKPHSLFVDQWEAYANHKTQTPFYEVLKSLLDYLIEHNTNTLEASTQIMILPGYQFRLVKKLITNFHQPKSTLLLLIAAFVGGDEWKRIYNFALENDFRFLSYGDSSLLEHSS